MAHGVLDFADAAGLETVDLLGFSGFVAQDVTQTRSPFVRRLVLAGTGPQGGQTMLGFTDDVLAQAMLVEPTPESLLFLFFTDSEASAARGWQFLQRIFTRTEGRDAVTGLAARDAQRDAILTWGIPDAGKLGRLAGIRQPTLVANGDNDKMVPTRNTVVRRLPRLLPLPRVPG